MKSYDKLIFDLAHMPEKPVDLSKLVSQVNQIPLHVAKKGIKQGLLTINNKTYYLPEAILKEDSVVRFQGLIVPNDYREYTSFDNFVFLVQDELKITELNDIQTSLKKPFCAYIIAYFSDHSYEQIVADPNQFLNLVTTELESFFRENFKEHKDTKVPRRKELIETLVKHRTSSLKELTDLVHSLLAGFFSKSLYKFLQEYTKIVNQQNFLQCVSPLLINSVFTRHTIDSLIKPIHEAQNKREIDEKFVQFNTNQHLYTAYIDILDKECEIDSEIFKKIGDYLFSLFKKECNAWEAKAAIINIYPTSRKYNFQNPLIFGFNLFVNIKNTGEGLAREIKLSPLDQNFYFNEFSLGTLKPNELREISLETRFGDRSIHPTFCIRCSWIDGSGASTSADFELSFEAQNANVPWELLERQKPYTIQEIEDREKLYGRDEIMKELEQNIRSYKIESYKLWGQKRVGKSSIVKTLKTLFNEEEKIIVVWRSIAGLKNVDPIQTLNTLGESLCSEIFEEIDRKFINEEEKAKLRSVPVPEFDGSLFPLETYIKKLRRLDGSLKFVFILDEFDRINEEFFLPGNLGDSFSLNIGKGLSVINYVGFILVGSENMHLLDRQEINYNSFQGREIDTFHKKREFESFKNIITGPVTPFISYSDDSIESIFDVTNGNPYFANLICSHVFKSCLKLKDVEVDIHSVEEAVNIIVESSQKSHFEHFWGDGISDESNVRKERKADIRRRILVSYSLTYFQDKTFPGKSQIIRNFKKPSEYDIETYEIENTITEFFNRKIFSEDQPGVIRIKPNLFEKWLCGPGRTLMIEGVSDLEALQKEKQSESEHAIKQDELDRLSEKLLFKGERIKADVFQKYFNQFGSPFEQRRIFNLLDSIYYISKNEISDFIQKERKNVFRTNKVDIKDTAKTAYRENVEIYSFPRTLEENIEFVETFKRLTSLRSTKTLKNIQNNKDAWRTSGADDIVIFESVIDDFTDIEKDLLEFLNQKTLIDKTPVKLFVLLLTTKAKAFLTKATSVFANFKVIHYLEVEDSKIKPFIDTSEFFETPGEKSYAFHEVRKRFHETVKDSLNVVFETHCPSKSLPILWCSDSQYKAIFPNTDGVIYSNKKEDNGEMFRTRIFKANTEFSQAINHFLIDYLKNKAKKSGFTGEECWFRVDFIPPGIIESVTKKWVDDKSRHPKQTYFDLINYKEIIKKNRELIDVFKIPGGGGDGLEWFDKLNEIRRNPAHPEKVAASEEEAIYFENKKDEILERIAKRKF